MSTCPYMFTHIYGHMHIIMFTGTYMYACIQRQTNIYTHTLTYVYAHTHIQKYMHEHMYICTHVCTHTCTRTCVYANIYIHTGAHRVLRTWWAPDKRQQCLFQYTNIWGWLANLEGDIFMQDIISMSQGESENGGISLPNNSEINTIRKHKHKCMKTYTHTHTCTDRHIHANTDTHTPLHTHTHTYTYTYVRTRTHTHTNSYELLNTVVRK